MKDFMGVKIVPKVRKSTLNCKNAVSKFQQFKLLHSQDKNYDIWIMRVIFAQDISSHGRPLTQICFTESAPFVLMQSNIIDKTKNDTA